MEPLYLVDGSGYIFRAYYAIAPLSNSKGLSTNALFGFVRMLVKLLRDVQAHYIAVTFDRPEPTFRHEMYSAYKANRAECPADLVPQMPYFRKIVDAFGIPCLEKAGFEADDIIATITEHFKSQGQKIVIVSGDKDLTQLVDDNVQVWDAMRDLRFNQEVVKEKFGVLPNQMVDYLALTGDASDNIPGVKGIGPKTAQRLIEHFGSLDLLIEHVDQIQNVEGLRGGAGIQKKIASDLETLRLSHQLVSLDKHVSPFDQITDIKSLAWQSVKEEKLLSLIEELEFSRIIESLPLSANTQFSRSAKEPKKNNNEKEFIVIDSQGLSNFANLLRNQTSFAFDTETTSLNVFDCKLVGISISWEAGKAYYLPIYSEVETERNLDRNQVRELLGPIFADPKIKKVGLNLKYDVEVLNQHAYQVRGLYFDGMLASYVINPDKRQHGLKSLAKIHLKEDMLSYKDLVTDKENIAWVPIDQVSKYAGHDAEASWRLMEVLIAELQKGAGLLRVFNNVEMPLVAVLADMEQNGIKIDVNLLDRLELEFAKELNNLERIIYDLAGKEFNLNSPKQLSVVLFEDLKIGTQGLKKTQSGFSTDASVLSKLVSEHEIISKITDYRELFKLQTTYVQALKRLLNPKTGRIHTSFNQAVAATGRLSSSDPNLQNIPIRNPLGRQLRQAFIADVGKLLVSVDYSQIELRLLAHLSNDSNLIRAFNEGEDIHLSTAKEIFGNTFSSEEERKELRRVAKTINFGIIYGMSAFRLANELGVSRTQAKRYIDDYFGRYPQVLTYFERLKIESEQRGYVETLFGRRRYLSDIDTRGRDAGYAGRSVMNAPLQGSAAEIIKVAMINLHARFQEVYNTGVKMLLQVHDELVLEVDEHLVDEVKEVVVREMEQAVKLDVPLRVDVSVGKFWGENE